MTMRHEPVTRSGGPVQGPGHDHGGHGGRGGHGWMMIACCIPMIAIFVALWAAGVVSAVWLLFAAACTAMMALMMGAMGHDGRS